MKSVESHRKRPANVNSHGARATSSEGASSTPCAIMLFCRGTARLYQERKALHLGADAYLRKPIDRERLLDILDPLTGNRSVTRVLLVDDEEVTRYLVRQLLPRGVYDVREARTGNEGWAQLLNEPPDVLLLDLKMPEMTGFELLDRIGGDESLDAVPAIVLTSAILTSAERQRLRRAARIMSKSDLSGSGLTGAISDVLGGLPSGNIQLGRL